MLRKEQIEYALHYAENPVEWVFELVRNLEKRIDELSKFGTKVTVFQEHWHPASEHPPVDKETGFSELVVGIMPGATVGFPRYVRYHKNKFYDRWIDGYTGVPSAIDIKRWCYPPEED